MQDRCDVMEHLRYNIESKEKKVSELSLRRSLTFETTSTSTNKIVSYVRLPFNTAAEQSYDKVLVVNWNMSLLDRY